MKNILSVIFLFPLLAWGQYNLDSLGVNNDKKLNADEVLYIEAILANQLSDGLDLSTARFHFASGNWGATSLTKSEFLKEYCLPRTTDSMSISIEVVELSPEEQEQYGVDIMLIAWTKIKAVGKARKKFLENIEA